MSAVKNTPTSKIECAAIDGPIIDMAPIHTLKTTDHIKAKTVISWNRTILGRRKRPLNSGFIINV